MEKQLKLYGSYGKYDEASFVVVDKASLLIKLTDKAKANVTYYATIQKDTLTEKLQIIDNVFEVPSKFLNAGIINIKISLYFKGQILKEFMCEQLVIKEINKQLNLIPEIEDLKGKLEENKKAFEESIKKLEDLIKIILEVEGIGL